VLAPAEIARHPQRLGVGVDDDHGVDAIFVATATVIFHGLAGPVLSR